MDVDEAIVRSVRARFAAFERWLAAELRSVGGLR